MSRDIHYRDPETGFTGSINTGEDEGQTVNAIIQNGGEVTAIGTSKIPVRDEELNQ
jgi:hypothetical protein